MSYDDTMIATSAIYRIRFTLQDTMVDNEFLSDAELQYILTTRNDDEPLATLDAARRMLAQFAQYTREREGLIEVYGNEVFNQWKRYLDDLVKDLASGGTVGYTLIGGVQRTEVDRVKCDQESVDGGYEQNWIANKRTHTSANQVSSFNKNISPFRFK